MFNLLSVTFSSKKYRKYNNNKHIFEKQRYFLRVCMYYHLWIFIKNTLCNARVVAAWMVNL